MNSWGLVMEGPVVQTFATEQQARNFQLHHAAFWGRKAPLVQFVEGQWVWAAPNTEK